MKKLTLISIVLAAVTTQANATELLTGHVYPNSTPVSKVCDALLLKLEPRCEKQDEYTVVAIVTKETESADAVDIEAVNALVKKDDFANYIDKNVKAKLEKGRLAEIVEVVN